MNQPCLKLTAYFGERQRAVGDDARFLADAMFDIFGSSDVATSVMLRGIASFGPSHELRTDVSLSLSEDPAVAIAAVDTEPKIRSLVGDVAAMTGRGLLTLERARLVTPQRGALDDVGSHNGDAAKLTVYVGRQERIAGKAAYYAVCELLHQHGFAGAIVLLGVDGTAHGERYRARFFGRNVNVPMMIIAIGSTAQVSAAATELAAADAQPAADRRAGAIVQTRRRTVRAPPAAAR